VLSSAVKEKVQLLPKHYLMINIFFEKHVCLSESQLVMFLGYCDLTFDQVTPKSTGVIYLPWLANMSLGPL
jgi:hypothetical protein